MRCFSPRFRVRHLNDEKQIALDALGQDRQTGAQNLQWALLNLTEFFFNY